MKLRRTEKLDVTELFRTLNIQREDIYKHCKLVGCHNLESCTAKKIICNEKSEEAKKIISVGAKLTPYIALRNFIVEIMLCHVRYTTKSEPGTDIFQDGVLGLIRAVELYDPNRGTNFKTYLHIHLRKAIFKHFEKSPIVRKPHIVTDVVPSIALAYESILQDKSKSLSISKVTKRIIDIRRERGLKTIYIPKRIIKDELHIMRSWENTTRKKEVFVDQTSEQQQQGCGLYDLMCQTIEKGLEKTNPVTAEMLRLKFGLPPYNRPASTVEISSIMGIHQKTVRFNLKRFFNLRGKKLQKDVSIIYN